MLLKKSVLMHDLIFPGALVCLSDNGLGGHVNNRLSNGGASQALYEALD
jgi:hypothetical protein